MEWSLKEDAIQDCILRSYLEIGNPTKQPLLPCHICRGFPLEKHSLCFRSDNSCSAPAGEKSVGQVHSIWLAGKGWQLKFLQRSYAGVRCVLARCSSPVFAQPSTSAFTPQIAATRAVYHHFTETHTHKPLTCVLHLRMLISGPFLMSTLNCERTHWSPIRRQPCWQPHVDFILTPFPRHECYEIRHETIFRLVWPKLVL